MQHDLNGLPNADLVLTTIIIVANRNVPVTPIVKYLCTATVLEKLVRFGIESQFHPFYMHRD